MELDLDERLYYVKLAERQVQAEQDAAAEAKKR